jgi:ribosomal protein S18 acetylase RimI-like enzyme
MSHAVAQPLPNPLPGTLSDWRGTLGAHYLRLGRESRRRRFMAALPDSAMRLIAGRASPDLVLGIRSERRVVGVVEIFRGAGSHAEIGISVEDAFQGRGFGRALLTHGLAAAERIGVTTADLFFASDNRGIRHLVSAAGGCIIQNGPECEAHIDCARCRLADTAMAERGSRP